MDTNQIKKLEFKQCPNCGGTKRVAQEVLEQEHMDGKCVDVKAAFLYQYKSLIAPPDGRFLSAKVVISFYDVCEDCGTVYVPYVEVRTAVQGMMPKPQIGTTYNPS